MEYSVAVLNLALGLSMEFGEHWLQSIDKRLLALHPELDDGAVLKIGKLCREVNTIAHKFVSEHPVKSEAGVSFVAFYLFEAFMISKYDWIDAANLSSLYSQGCYYALK